LNKSLVSCRWLKEHINDDSLIILDASPKSNLSGLESEFAEKRIKGARSIDIKANFSDKDSEMPNTLLSTESFQEAVRTLGINNEHTIVVYDNLGIYTSPRVWWMFKAMGHENIAVLDGGLPEWVREGNPIEDLSELDITKGNFTAAFDKNMVKHMSDVVENVSSKNALVLDARSKGRFDGTAPEPRQGLSSGHIPNSKNLPFKNVLDDGKMKSSSELKSLFEAKGIGSEPLIFSCGSGLTACITYLAADIALENEKTVYDGSWTEWAQKQTDLIEQL